jgi:5'-nucleotidase
VREFLISCEDYFQYSHFGRSVIESFDFEFQSNKQMHSRLIKLQISSESQNSPPFPYLPIQEQTNPSPEIVKAGVPSIGTDPNDSHIWYYNGTPSACVQVALDYIFPAFTNMTNGTSDLVLSGPNYGDNVGDFAYTRSGTIGATYFAIGREILAITYSANCSYGVGIPYYQVNATTPAGLKDPAMIARELAADLAQHLIVKADGGRVLPLGYGVNVNFPYITSYVDTSCVNPPFIQSRMTGGAYSYCM